MSRVEQTKQNQKNWFRGQSFLEDDFDPEFEEIAQRFLCGEILPFGSLSDVEKSLICLTALTTCRNLGAIEKYTLAALDRGAKPEEIKETLYQCAPYIGLETVHDALKEVNKAFGAAGISRPEVKQGTVTKASAFSGKFLEKKILILCGLQRHRNYSIFRTLFLPIVLVIFILGEPWI